MHIQLLDKVQDVNRDDYKKAMTELVKESPLGAPNSQAHDIMMATLARLNKRVIKNRQERFAKNKLINDEHNR